MAVCAKKSGYSCPTDSIQEVLTCLNHSSSRSIYFKVMCRRAAHEIHGEPSTEYSSGLPQCSAHGQRLGEHCPRFPCEASSSVGWSPYEMTDEKTESLVHCKLSFVPTNNYWRSLYFSFRENMSNYPKSTKMISNLVKACLQNVRDTSSKMNVGECFYTYHIPKSLRISRPCKKEDNGEIPK